jgi:hypothetical protein
MKQTRLTPAMRQDIVSTIRAGGYPHVAAEAWAVAKDRFDDWLKRGGLDGAREPYRSFARDVRQAFAQARLRAEIAIHTDEPKTWLIHGPGRETEARPGWSVSVKPAATTPELRNVLLDQELMAIFRAILNALEAYPEARVQMAKTLLDLGVEATPKAAA